MRTAPAFQLVIEPPAQTRRALIGLASLAAAVCAGWLAQRLGADPFATLCAAATAGGMAVAVAGRSVHRVALRLRWDSAQWFLGPAGADPRMADTPGELRVMADLGSLMLLRFDPCDRRAGRVRWLAAQHGALQAHWHLLRCAVYSPRPSDPPATAGTRPTSHSTNDSR